MLALKSFRKLRTNLPQAIFDQSHIKDIFFSPKNSTKKTKKTACYRGNIVQYSAVVELNPLPSEAWTRKF